MNNIQIKVIIVATAIFIVSCSIKNRSNSGINRVFFQSNIHQQCIDLGNEKIRRVSR